MSVSGRVALADLVERGVLFAGSLERAEKLEERTGLHTSMTSVDAALGIVWLWNHMTVDALDIFVRDLPKQMPLYIVLPKLAAQPPSLLRVLAERTHAELVRGEPDDTELVLRACPRLAPLVVGRSPSRAHVFRAAVEETLRSMGAPRRVGDGEWECRGGRAWLRREDRRVGVATRTVQPRAQVEVTFANDPRGAGARSKHGSATSTYGGLRFRGSQEGVLWALQHASLLKSLADASSGTWLRVARRGHELSVEVTAAYRTELRALRRALAVLWQDTRGRVDFHQGIPRIKARVHPRLVRAAMPVCPDGLWVNGRLHPGRRTVPPPVRRPSSSRSRDEVDEHLRVALRDAASWVSAQAEWTSGGLEIRGALELGDRRVVVRVERVGDELRLSGALPDAPRSLELSPEKGLWGWWRSLHELEVGVQELDDAWVIRGDADELPALERAADALLDVGRWTRHVEVEPAHFRMLLTDVDDRDAARALDGALRAWRAFVRTRAGKE